MKVYIIGGKAKNGKNTFAKFLKEELKNNGYKPCIMHLTEPLYSYAKNYFEYNTYFFIIVNELNYSKPSVSIAMKKLKDNGYIEINNSNISSITHTS